MAKLKIGLIESSNGNGKVFNINGVYFFKENLIIINIPFIETTEKFVVTSIGTSKNYLTETFMYTLKILNHEYIHETLHVTIGDKASTAYDNIAEYVETELIDIEIGTEVST